MRAPVAVAAYGGALVLAFTAALGVGSAVGEPVAPAPQAHSDMDETAAPGGLAVSDQGHTLVLDSAGAPAGPAVPVSFRVLDETGEAVTSYEVDHEQELHLIAVRRDLTGYQHVHPARAADGTWSTPLDLTPGTWRLFADFVPSGGEVTDLALGVDLQVAGAYVPAPPRPPGTSAAVGGYTVDLDGALVPGQETELTFSVSRGGEPVTDLQPYLGAYGHLVVLRGGDLAYLHVHPGGEPGDGATEPGPDVTFFATAPSAGDYRLFLDFRHDGLVRTAELTVRADEGPS